MRKVCVMVVAILLCCSLLVGCSPVDDSNGTTHSGQDSSVTTTIAGSAGSSTDTSASSSNTSGGGNQTSNDDVNTSSKITTTSTSKTVTTSTQTTKENIVPSTSDSANAFDGDEYTIWVAEKEGKTVLTYTFSEPVTFNTISFNEYGNWINDYWIEIPDGTKWKRIYRQSKMLTHVGVVDETYTVSKVRLTAISSRKVSIRDIVFSMGNKVTVKEPYRVVSYFPAPQMPSNRSNYDKLDLITDLIVCGYGAWSDTGHYMWFENGKQDLENQLKELRQEIGNRKIRLWFGLGGYNQGADLDKIFSTPEIRKNLINEALSIAEEYGFYGMDIDYEYPVTDKQWNNYSLLLTELGAALHAKNIRLSAALSGYNTALTKQAIDSIDYANIMMYEDVAFAIDDVARFINIGFKPSQLILGLAFFSFSDRGDQGYNYLVSQYGSNIKQYTTSYDGLRIQGHTVTRDLTYWAIQNGCAGVFSWHFGCDIPLTDERSLMRAVSDAVNRFTAVS